MKKTLIALILAVVFVLSFALCVSAADNESTDAEGDIILGDVNGDGLITNADVLMIYRYIYNSELYPLPTVCNHSYGDWTIESLATCETDGEISRTCEKCDETETSTVKGGHIYEETVVDPTPADEGYTKHECQRCGDIYKDNFVPALGFTSGFAYTVNSDNKTCTVIGLGSVTDTKIAIPEEIDGYKVTAIGEKAFENKTQLTEIIIPDTVKTIGTRAFYGCTGITEMTIPASVTDIGTQIFYKASNLATVYYNSSYGSSDNPVLGLAHIKKVVFGGTIVPSHILKNASGLKEVVIPDSVTSIGGWAFDGCTSLVSIEIPDSVTSIGDSAFEGCTSLTSVTIGDSVTSIGWEAFSGCTTLTSVNIPDSVTSIGDGAFSGCTLLKDVYISNIEAWLNISFGDYSSNPCNNGANLYLNGELLTSVEIPDSVTSIGWSAFEGCTSLVSIEIPDSVTSIGWFAFEGCTSLVSIEIPDSVTSIGERAFYGCTSLASIEIFDSVTSIGGSAFSGCTSLESITIPDSVTSIGNYAFSGCTSLESITIPDSVTSIGNYAFSGCTSLTSIEIPNSVTSIGWSAFEGCTSLTSITIPDSVTSIGESAFADCKSLTSIEIPDSVTSIGDWAFDHCTSLKDVYYTGTQEQWGQLGIDSYYINYATIHYNYVAA